MKKKVLLTILFIIPLVGVLIFNFFSKSHFNIQVYYQNEIPQLADCEDVSAPYAVNRDVRIGDQGIFQNEKIKIIGFSDHTETYRTQLNRIADSYYGNDKAEILSIGLPDSIERTLPLAGNIEEYSAGKQDIDHWKNCVFLFEEGGRNNAVLIDFENRIRGYYNLGIKEQADSLIIEGKILIREKDF